jgi:hypothetical protein
VPPYSTYLDDLEDDPEKVADEILRSGVKSPAHIPMPHIRDHQHLTPVFAFDHLSLSGTDFCFNNPKIPATDWVKLMHKCNQVSKLKYSEMLDKSYEDEHRFHIVPHSLLIAAGLMPHLREICTRSAKSSKILIPDIYQFGLYTDHLEEKAPRILGFVGKWAVFYLIWFDLKHLIYQKKH